MKIIIKIIFYLFVFLNTPLFSTIVNTKHNLSTTGPGTVKAQTETEICVFCHIPHSAMTDGKPLWNRSMPASAYTMYDSDYLRRIGYPAVESDLGTANDTPGALSRQCLSCHDGTVAIGAVHVLHGLADQTIAMDGVEADGTMLSTAAGFIGTDLTMHHPVGIEYDSTITMNFDTGSKTIELLPIPDSPVKLFEYGGKKYVECSSCHDPHTENDKFLHVGSEANFAQNVSTTCTSCHEKTDWTGSIHQTPPADALYTDVDTIARYGTDKMSDLGCANCHTPHNAGGTPYLNRQTGASTCFVGAAADQTGATCHGVGGYKDIESILGRAYSHPVLEEDTLPGNAHTDLDTLYGTGVVDPDGGKGIAWSDNKHAVCMDCHNQHKVTAGTHIVDGSWYGAPGASTNLVSNVLQGVAGIEPTWPAEWTQPTTFTTLESSTKEYQICLKCHSYWGLGSATNGINDAGYVSPSDGVTPLTDLAWDMNINNKSGHPVVINQDARTGSYDTSATDNSTGLRALDTTQLLTPWKENPGLNTMYCSDCHGADNELGGDPKGPHGSDLKYLLKGENQYWPKKSDGLTLYTMDDITAGTDTGVFCKNCHDIAFPHDQWWNKMSNKGFKCVECHVGVPHGSPTSRLIGYYSFPSPYNYTDATAPNGWLKMQGYRKNDGLTVDPLDVWADGSLSGDTTCDGGTCHRDDDSGNGAYDANLMP